MISHEISARERNVICLERRVVDMNIKPTTPGDKIAILHDERFDPMETFVFAVFPVRELV